jgi:hypothetical protein
MAIHAGQGAEHSQGITCTAKGENICKKGEAASYYLLPRCLPGTASVTWGMPPMILRISWQARDSGTGRFFL